MTARRRRLPDRINLARRSDDQFAAGEWAADLAKSLSEISTKKCRTWQQRRDRTRLTLTLIRIALAEHPGVGRTTALDDLLVLEIALASLNSGEVHSIVGPGPRGNRLPDSAAKIQLRRLILQSAEHLIGSRINRKDAYDLIAEILYKLGMRTPRAKVDGPAGLSSLIKRWHQSTLPGRTGKIERPADAAWLERWASQSPATTPPEAKANVRAWFADPVVRSLLPEVHKGDLLTH